MKSMKLAVALGCAALIALACSPGASADAICKKNEVPCSAPEAWPTGTQFEWAIKSGTEVKMLAKNETKCTASTRTDELTTNEAPGAPGVPAVVEALSEKFSGCSIPGLSSCTVTTKEVTYPVNWYGDPNAPTGNGYSSTSAQNGAKKIETLCGVLPCTWEYAETKYHTYQGGSPATEKWKTIYSKSSSSSVVCGPEMSLEGEREIVSPSKWPIYWIRG